MRNVVITGVGIKSCIGNTYDEVLNSLKDGNQVLQQMKHIKKWVSEVRFLGQLI